jgi:hypothetical protein
MSSRIVESAIIIASLAAAGCSDGIGGRTSATSAFALPSVTGPTVIVESDSGETAPPAGLFGLAGTVKEALSGPAIEGVVPEGEAQADMSQFASGGATILTVRIRNVNLPDGTLLQVTLDFTPVGTITLSRREGTLTTSLGHFGVSRDQVRVNTGGVTILGGGLFR